MAINEVPCGILPCGLVPCGELPCNTDGSIAPVSGTMTTTRNQVPCGLMPCDSEGSFGVLAMEVPSDS